jgi:hypothetical protein
MALACWQSTIVDDSGNVVPNASITVLREIAGQPPAQCYSDLVESASAGVAITNQTPATWDWDTGINFTLTISQATQIATPSNGQPGTWRTIMVQGNDATDRTITFSSDFEGDIPTITDCDSGRWYMLMIFCVTASHFVVSSKKANGT